jgi:3-hydroxyisobutyrate dehydrogenase-like beta-hydroxyacid dehydrogenase
MPTSVALVGFGPWGRNIARNLNQLGVLTVVCDPDLQARAAAKSAYPQVITVEHPEQVPTDCAVAIWRGCSWVASSTFLSKNRWLCR